MNILGTDYDYSQRLYNQQWQYPYIMNIAETPETHAMPEPNPIASPKDEQAQNASQTTTANQNQTALSNSASLNQFGPVMSELKVYLIPALIALLAVIIYSKFKN